MEGSRQGAADRAVLPHGRPGAAGTGKRLRAAAGRSAGAHPAGRAHRRRAVCPAGAAAQRPFPEPQPRAGLGKDPEQRGQLHLLEGQLAAAVSGKQVPPAVAHLPAVRLFCHLAPGGLCGRNGTGQGQKGVQKAVPGQGDARRPLCGRGAAGKTGRRPARGAPDQHRSAAVQHPPRFSGGAAGLGAEPDLPQLGAVHGGCRTGRGRGCPRTGACPHRQPYPLPETGQQRGHCGQHQSGVCPCHR